MREPGADLRHRHRGDRQGGGAWKVDVADRAREGVEGVGHGERIPHDPAESRAEDHGRRGADGRPDGVPGGRGQERDEHDPAPDAEQPREEPPRDAEGEVSARRQRPLLAADVARPPLEQELDRGSRRARARGGARAAAPEPGSRAGPRQGGDARPTAPSTARRPSGRTAGSGGPTRPRRLSGSRPRGWSRTRCGAPSPGRHRAARAPRTGPGPSGTRRRRRRVLP